MDLETYAHIWQNKWQELRAPAPFQKNADSTFSLTRTLSRPRLRNALPGSAVTEFVTFILGPSLAGKSSCNALSLAVPSLCTPGNSLPHWLVLALLRCRVARVFGSFRCVCSVCPFRAMVLDSSGFLWESEKSYGSPQPLPQMHTCATFELQLHRLMDPWCARWFLAAVLGTADLGQGLSFP